MQELVDFGAFIKSKRSRDKVVKADINLRLFFPFYAPACPITARQYGEVVLPDASTGHDPDTLATKLSRCKEGMAHFLPSGYKFY